jgi:hypothetical protein
MAHVSAETVRAWIFARRKEKRLTPAENKARITAVTASGPLGDTNNASKS